MAEFAAPTYNVTHSPENDALEAYWDDLPTLKIIEVERKVAGFVIKHSYEVTDLGDPDGDVVLWFGGSPISAIDSTPRSSVMVRNGIRVISISKPGYGDSSRQAGRLVCDASQWAEDIVNALGIDKFSVFGRSGGGPHALAVAHYLPDRVKKVVALSSPSPFDPNDPVWSMNMSEGNKRAAALVAAGNVEALWQGYEGICHDLQDDPMALLDALEKDRERPLPYCDRMMLTPQMKHLVGRAHQLATRNGPAGWVDDNVANFNPPERGGWCIEDLGKIQCPALLAGHEQDPYTPFEHARRLVAAIGKNAILLRGRDSHFTNLDSIHYLNWLTTDSPEDRKILVGIAEELRDWSLLRSLRSDVGNP